MTTQREFGRFLASRRARVGPGEVGLTTDRRRRVSGLRREEVAQLAGISVEYYVRLEQGRALHPSEEVLDALSRALSLDDVERAHLTDLVGGRRSPRRRGRAQPARPELATLLREMTGVPALIVDDCLQVLVWNHLARQLFFDFAAVTPKRRNLARFAFLDPASVERFVEWDVVARDAVGQLRLAVGRYPTDETLATLLGELSMGSDVFRRLWAGRDVRERTHGIKRFRHPVVGELALAFENFELCGGTGQRLVTFSATTDAARDALAMLAMWTSAPDRDARLVDGPAD